MSSSFSTRPRISSKVRSERSDSRRHKADQPLHAARSDTVVQEGERVTVKEEARARAEHPRAAALRLPRDTQARSKVVAPHRERDR